MIVSSVIYLIGIISCCVNNIIFSIFLSCIFVFSIWSLIVVVLSFGKVSFVVILLSDRVVCYVMEIVFCSNKVIVSSFIVIFFELVGGVIVFFNNFFIRKFRSFFYFFVFLINKIFLMRVVFLIDEWNFLGVKE